MAILLIEDNEKHYKGLYDFISTCMLRSCFPESIQNNTTFISAVRHWLTKGDWPDGDHKLGRYLDLDPDVIILDMELDETQGVLGGKKVLEIIRKTEKTKYTPVLILTSSEFEHVDDCFRHNDYFANYYLNKSLDGKTTLSNEFFEKRLHPVLHMLTNWKAIASSNTVDAHRTMLNQLDEIYKMIEAQNGLINASVNEVLNSIATSAEEIITLSKIHLRIIQVQVKEKDPRLNNLIDNFVANFSGYNFSNFPEVQNKRDQIAEFFLKSKDEMKKILKKGVEEKAKDEFMEYVEDKIKEIAGCDSDSTLTVAVAKIIYQTVGQTWKIIKFDA